MKGELEAQQRSVSVVDGSVPCESIDEENLSGG